MPPGDVGCDAAVRFVSVPTGSLPLARTDSHGHRPRNAPRRVTVPGFHGQAERASLPIRGYITSGREMRGTLHDMRGECCSPSIQDNGAALGRRGRGPPGLPHDYAAAGGHHGVAWYGV